MMNLKKSKKALIIVLAALIIAELPYVKTNDVCGGYKGWITKKGYTYYYNKNGNMVTGLTNIDMDTYYFLKKDYSSMNKGALVKGWKKLSDNYYFFSRQTGAMVKGEVIDGIKISDDGRAKVSKTDTKILDQRINARWLVEKIAGEEETKSDKKNKCMEYLEKEEGLKEALDSLSIKYTEESLEDVGEAEVLRCEVKELIIVECGYDSSSYVNLTKKAAKVSKVRLKKAVLYENGDIKVRWTKSNSCDSYLLYKKASGECGYSLIKKTTKRGYKDTDTIPGKRYYYRVVALKNETALTRKTFSKHSATKKCLSRKKPSKTAYLGDSVMSGFDVYDIIGSGEKSFAEVGQSINTLNNSGMGEVLDYKPDRVFIMSGTNDCVGNRSDDQLKNDIDSYISVCKKLYNVNNKVEIIAMGIGPTNTDRVPMDNVNRYNRFLKNEASKYNYIHFFNTASFLKGKDGHIKSEYVAGDGIHWSGSAYTLIYGKLKNFVAKWKV